MPYNAVTKDGIELNNIPDHITPDSPELKQIVTQERSRLKWDQIDKDSRITPEQAGARAAEGMGTGQRALANIGAGMTNAWEGIKQVMPGMKGSSDEEINKKRVYDEALAKSSETGMGADWMPSAGKALQFVGQEGVTALPALGVGRAVLAAGRALPMATRMLSRGLPAAALEGAGAGAAAGGFAPVTSEESRGGNIALGAAGGAAAPAVIAGARMLPKAVRMLDPQHRAGRLIANDLGDEAANVAAQAERGMQNVPPSVRGIPRSMAEVTNNPQVAQIERQSAIDQQPAWAQHREGQVAGTFDALENIARPDPAALGAIRDANTGPLRQAAMGAAGNDQFFQVPVAQEVARIANSASSANPAVRGVLAYVDSVIGPSARSTPTPQALYEMRKVLTDKLHGPHQIGDELSSAVKGADRQVMAIVRSIDDALEQASGGRWSQYMDTYRAESGPVTSAAAGRDLLERAAPMGGPTSGGVPDVSRNSLAQAARRVGTGEFGDRFTPRTRQLVDELIGDLQQREQAQRTLKAAGTSGGGSNTAMDLTQRAANAKLPGVGMVLKQATRGFTQGTQREVAHMLQNPDQAIAAIREQLRLRQPISAASQQFLAAIGIPAGTLIAQPSQQTAQ